MKPDLRERLRMEQMLRDFQTKDKPPQNEVLPPGTLLPFPTERQQQEFKRRREAGTMTFFRTRQCDNCKAECPNAFQFCSRDCHDKVNPPKNAP